MYRNASQVLPEELLKKVQEYIQGENLYIPNASSKAAWGESNGTREHLKNRNLRICQDYTGGMPIALLMEKYHLGYDSIRKILRNCGKE